jgi:hypothetical protein
MKTELKLRGLGYGKRLKKKKRKEDNWKASN